MCAIAAPARAASSAASAIWSGVTGTPSLRPAVSPTPVTAQVTKTSQFILCTIISRGGRCEQATRRPLRRRPALGLGSRGLRQPRGAHAEPRPPRRRGHRVRARALPLAALRALSLAVDERPTPLPHPP